MRGNKWRRGLTLIEVVIGLAIAAIATSVAVGAINSLTNASLRSVAIDLTGAIKFSYDRAIMERRTQRISIDLDKGTWWIDFTHDPYSLAAERARGTEGAKASDPADGEAVEKEKRSIFEEDEDEAAKKAVLKVLEGGQAASFEADTDLGGLRTISSDVRFTKVWTGHQDEAFTTGVAVIHFFSGGWSEPAEIELSDGDEFLTLKIYPLTGRVRSYPRAIEAPEPEDDDGREEGDE